MVDVVVGLIDITLSPWYFNQFLSKTQSLIDPFCESDLVPGGHGTPVIDPAGQ
jgi:hypothetical protein